MKWVTIFSTFNPAEAQLIRSRLDAAGFPVEVINELSSLSTEGYSLATGGIDVRVPQSVATDARNLIAPESDES